MKLFETEPLPEPPQPTRAELRLLHLLCSGKLVFRSRLFRGFDVFESSSDLWPNHNIRFREATARNIVESGWAELSSFNASRGEYRITTAGREFADRLCECKPSPPRVVSNSIGNKSHLDEETELLVNRLVCRHCARLVPCVSRKANKHAGNRMHWKWGAVCNEHWEAATGKNRRRA